MYKPIDSMLFPTYGALLEKSWVLYYIFHFLFIYLFVNKHGFCTC